jgi:predicted PurR-regulated permease PerM
MSFPSPTPKQARVLWLSISALAVCVLVALGLVLFLGIGALLNRLSSILLPLAMAGILSYLLDPVVDFLERRKIPRSRAIWLVFFLACGCVLIVLAGILPVLIVEIGELIRTLPDNAATLRKTLSEWMAQSHLGAKARQVWESQFAETAQGWLAKAAPVVSEWMISRLMLVASWAGLIVGLALVPVYLYYFLLEKEGISRHWMDYLPIRDSWIKEEVVFVLNAINDCLIVFFRGQILVALCDGALLTICFFALGLNYAVLLGMVAGFLSVVPYLGVAISLIPAIGLAIVQFGDWYHPVVVLAIFAMVQTLEGLVISPRIMGNRVGLHPLTIIIAVMVGTTLLGGILGGVLAIPLTAALRVLMLRYVWIKRG